MSINQVIISGNVGQNPELKNVNGSTVTRLSVATDDGHYDKQQNTWVQKVQWHNVSIWGKQAEQVCQHVTKGSAVTVQGSIEYRKYTNKQGIEKEATNIKAFKIDYQRQANQNNGQNYQQPAQQPQNNNGQPAQYQQQQPAAQQQPAQQQYQQPAQQQQQQQAHQQQTPLAQQPAAGQPAFDDDVPFSPILHPNLY